MLGEACLVQTATKANNLGFTVEFARLTVRVLSGNTVHMIHFVAANVNNQHYNPCIDGIPAIQNMVRGLMALMGMKKFSRDILPALTTTRTASELGQNLALSIMSHTEVMVLYLRMWFHFNIIFGNEAIFAIEFRLVPILITFFVQNLGERGLKKDKFTFQDSMMLIYSDLSLLYEKPDSFKALLPYSSS